MRDNRTNSLRLLVYLSFLVLLWGLFFFQIIMYRHYHDMSVKNAIRLIPIEGARGRIIDRNKQVLAASDISFDMAVIPKKTEDIQSALSELSNISGISYETLSANYQNNYYLPFAPVRIATNLSREKAFLIEEHMSSVPGSLIWVSPQRRYPNKDIASHIIGYIGKIQKEEFERLKDYGYQKADLVGKAGIEKYYDTYLKGEDGGIQIQVDAYSRIVKQLGFKEAKEGKDVQLTIDLGLQTLVDDLLRDKKGSCIIMDAKSGAILALASSPEFDPGVFITGDSGQRHMILNDRGKPLLNRAVSCTYPPGSTFKIVVAAAGLATSRIDERTSFLCNEIFKLGNKEFRCWKEGGHGMQNVTEALCHSCNIFFYNLGLALKAEGIYNYALIFGLGTPTNIDLPYEANGVVPSPLWKRVFVKEPWYKGDTINYAIGQGYLLVTPIQMLRIITIITNEGFSPTPYIVEKIGGRTLAQKKPYITKIKHSVYEVIKEGLFKVVNDPTGTGQYASLKDLEIAGKTGTAQPGTTGATHGWFVGYLPADKPKFSFVVFLEHGGQGGMEPAHIVRLISTYLKENGFLKS
jgi:penicillin-binding protein 2